MLPCARSLALAGSVRVASARSRVSFMLAARARLAGLCVVSVWSRCGLVPRSHAKSLQMRGSRASRREAVHGFCPPNRYLTLHREPVREAMTEAVCKATMAAGEPCKARPLRGEEFCLLHTPGAARAIGTRGGRARGKSAELEPVSDREQAMAALRRALDGNNRRRWWLRRRRCSSSTARRAPAWSRLRMRANSWTHG
jgi:hypothetical protein